MATKKQIEEFVSAVGPIISTYALRNGYKFPSAIIAQAIHESGVTSKLATQYHNYWGMKVGTTYSGPSVNLKTQEYVKGTYINCQANWRAYSSIEEGVKGYFDFLKMKRYQNLKNCVSPENYIVTIVTDGWCTSPLEKYYNSCLKYINDYDLRKYDSSDVALLDNLGAYRITASALRIRKIPTITSECLGKIEKGGVIKPIEKKAFADGSIWYRTYDGWMCGRLKGIDYVEKI